MPERPESLPIDRHFISAVSRYSALRANMAWRQGHEEGMETSLRMQAIAPVVREVANEECALRHRDALPLLADTAAMASLAYEPVSPGMLTEDRQARDQITLLAKGIFLKVSGRLFSERRGPVRTQFAEALTLLQSGIEDFSREIAIPLAISDQLAHLHDRASGLREQLQENDGFITSPACRRGLSVLQHDALEGMSVFFEAEQLNNHGRIHEETFARIENAFLKIARGARALFDIEEVLQKEERARLRAPHRATTWQQDGLPRPSVLNQASTAWGSPRSGRR